MEKDRLLLDQIASEAADWFTRLHGPHDTAAARAEFTRWLLRSPDHINEYLAVARIWNDLDGLRGEVPADELTRAALASAPPTNVVSLERKEDARMTLAATDAGRERRGRGFIHRASRRRTVVAAAAALVMCVGIGGFVMSRWFDTSHFTTRIGEQRVLTLADGSVLTLNTNSEVRIDFDRDERRIDLIRGEARFKVAKDAERPFIVATANAHVRAVGTIFNVRESAGQTSVAVFEGRVAVGRAEAERLAVADRQLPGTPTIHSDSGPRTDASPGVPGTRPAPMELSAGERAIVLARGEIVPNSGPPLERLRAWPSQTLVFRSETLETLVAEINRYHEHSVRIADPQIASVLVSGTFATSDLDSLVQYLERYRGIRAEHLADGGFLLLRAQP